MKKLAISLMVMLMAAVAVGQQQPKRFTITSTGSPCATVSIQNYSTVGIIVSGTWVGTFTPTLQIAGVSGAPTAATTVTPTNSTTSQGTVTANGGFKSATGGFTQFNFCPTAWSSGTATVDIFSTTALNSGLFGSASGGGSGTVTSVSSGNLSPLFTVTVNNATTTPAFVFGLSTAAADTILGNPTAGALGPVYTSAPIVTTLQALTSLSSGAAPPAACGGTAGCFAEGEGTAPTAVASVDELYASSALHDWAVVSNNGTGPGIVEHAAPGSITSTSNVAAISTATLCASAAGACNQAGRYRIDWDFSGGGTACTTVTAGAVTFLLTWTDANSIVHSAVALPMVSQAGASTGTMGTSFFFQTALANESAGGTYVIDTNGSVIQYATGYTACTAGVGNYTLNAIVTRIG